MRKSIGWCELNLVKYVCGEVNHNRILRCVHLKLIGCANEESKTKHFYTWDLFKGLFHLLLQFINPRIRTKFHSF